jgi:hypothetical protein
VQLLGEIASHAAAALDRDRLALETVRAPFPVRRRLHRAKDTVRRHGRGIAGFSRQASDVLRLHLYVGHVLGARAHVFGRDVAPAEDLNETTVSTEDLLTVLCLVVADNDRLAAAQKKSRHGVLVRHAARKSERIGNRLFVGGVLPESGSAESGSEFRTVNRENASVSNRGIAAHHDFLVPHLSQRVEQLHLFGNSFIYLVIPKWNFMIARRESARSRSSGSRTCPHKSR